MIEAPLTFSQWQHWEHLSARPGDLTTLYTHFEIDGKFEPTVFIDALEQVVQKQEALRIGIIEGGDGNPPRQRLHEIPRPAQLLSLRQIPAASRDEFAQYVRGFLAIELRKPWNPAEPYPCRMFLFRYSDTVHAFVGLFSHLAMDARGRTVFEGELWARYAAAVEPAARTPEPARAIGFLEAARRRGNLADYTRNAEFWLGQASRIPPRFTPASDLVEHSAETMELRDADLAALRRQALRSRSTEFQWILGGYATVLAELASAEEVKINMPVDTRRSDEQSLVGMFATALPLVVRPARDQLETQARIRRQLADLLAHRDVPPPVMKQVARTAVESAGAEWRDDVGIDYVRDEMSIRGLDFGRLSVRPDVYEPNVEYRNQGVQLAVSSTADRLTMKLTYARDSPVSGGPDGLGDRLLAGLLGLPDKVMGPRGDPPFMTHPAT